MGLDNLDSLTGDDRLFISTAAAGAVRNPEDVIEDWGDLNGDYASSDHNLIEADGNSSVEKYYQQRRPIEVHRIYDPNASSD